MSSLNDLTSKDFGPDHHKKGHKEIGWARVRILFEQDGMAITEPLHEVSRQDSVPDDYEYIVWEKDDPIAEFKSLDDARDFLRMKIGAKIYGIKWSGPRASVRRMYIDKGEALRTVVGLNNTKRNLFHRLCGDRWVVVEAELIGGRQEEGEK